MKFIQRRFAIVVLLMFSIPVSAAPGVDAAKTKEIGKLAKYKKLPNGDIEIIPYDVDEYIKAAGLKKTVS